MKGLEKNNRIIHSIKSDTIAKVHFDTTGYVIKKMKLLKLLV